MAEARKTPEAARASVPVCLASGSPRRRDLLREAGYDFTVVDPAGDESAARGDGTPEGLAVERASIKARSAAGQLGSGLVVGADTIVVLAGRVIGKPADRGDAKRMLSELSGTTHRVITGVSVVDAASGRELTRAVSTGIVMAPMSAAEIDEYVSSGEADGKAGAYAIQETADRFVREVRGSFTNVVGLPMEALEEMLAEMREVLDGRE